MRALVLSLAVLLLPAGAAQAVTIAPPTVPARLKMGVLLDQACASYYAPDENAGKPGTTQLAVYVTQNGVVGSASVLGSSGDTALDQAAATCVTSLGAVFVPASIGIIAVSSWAHVSINWSGIAGAAPKLKPEEPFFKIG